ncbi:hypothetical protein MYU51_006856, partial [Penicillium brevicompactum]
AWVHRQFGAQIKRFLTDNGREYLPIGTHLESQGVEFDTSPPYCKGQNGLAERTNRTIRERINTLLSDAKLSPSWWTELVDTVVYLKLRAPAARTSIDFTEEDTVRNIVREAALVVASATDRLPRMGVDSQRASSKARTQVVRVPNARLL